MSIAIAEAVHAVIGGALVPPRILVFDSGLGGLTVFAEIVKVRPTADYLYVADDAVFPYGRLSESDLVDRVMMLMERLIAVHRPDIVVIACNTASTLVLPPLRQRWPSIPFVGTVPAVKPAAATSRSKLISVLATPGTVAREYTRDLVRSFAQDCSVTLVGSDRLAVLAEAHMRGQVVEDAAILAEIAPCFIETGGQRTDVVVLACTHYPLLAATFDRLAPWPATFVDPAPAIARRVDALLSGHAAAVNPANRDGGKPPPSRALFTSGRAPVAPVYRALQARGLRNLVAL